MKQGIDAMRGLKYKLMIIVILIPGSSYNYEDHVSVVHNTSTAE